MAMDKSQAGDAKVVGNRYKISGVFHRMEDGTPIRGEEGELCGVTKPRDITHLHSYGGEAPFFDGLTRGKLLATRCDNPACDTRGSVHEPFRIHCPDCLEKMTAVDITDSAKKTAKLHSFMVCERSGAFNTMEKPIRFINVEFEGVCTVLMSYLSAGSPEIGMRVVPIFKTKDPTYTIIDLSWVPEGTPESELPEGFTFG